MTARHTPPELEGLGSPALNILRRLFAGKMVRCGRTSSRSIIDGRTELLIRDLVVVSISPKWRREWFELTQAGKALEPAIRRLDDDIAARANEVEKAEQVDRHMRNSALAMYRALEATRQMVGRIYNITPPECVAIRARCDEAKTIISAALSRARGETP
jgi:hypothetical protein